MGGNLAAIERAKKYYEEGYTYVVDLDSEKYFDTVNHDLLIKMVTPYIVSKAVFESNANYYYKPDFQFSHRVTR
ncbi:MAG: hypothetical protein LBH43_16140 [Treponema sp.]|jgi:retron-type reverse transcriptase|nr:hypothetical protein [Treponema sp.]